MNFHSGYSSFFLFPILSLQVTSVPLNWHAIKIVKKPVTIIDSALDGLTTTEGTVTGVRNSIMGFEGTAGRAYFQCISKIMPEKYIFKGRSRQPAKDPFNTVLNYCYGILYSKIEKTCILAGLDPYVGFLHTDNYNKKINGI